MPETPAPKKNFVQKKLDRTKARIEQYKIVTGIGDHLIDHKDTYLEGAKIATGLVAGVGLCYFSKSRSAVELIKTVTDASTSVNVIGLGNHVHNTVNNTIHISNTLATADNMPIAFRIKETGAAYRSLRRGADALGVSREALRQALDKGTPINGMTLEILELMTNSTA